MGFVATYIFTVMSYFLKQLYAGEGIIILAITAVSALIAGWINGTAHSFVAKKQGFIPCGIAKNPLKAISIPGTLSLAVFGFGFARTDDVLPISATKKQRLAYHCSGIVANTAAALLLSVIEGIFLFFAFLGNNTAFAKVIFLIFDIAIWIDFSLVITQIIPVPGFAGYYILKDLLFMNCRAKVLCWFEKYCKWIFLLLAAVGIVTAVCEGPTDAVFSFVGNLQEKIIDLITGGAYIASGW